MAEYPREELEEMWDRWIQANKDAEAVGDWRPMADLYTEDATYGWNLGASGEFMAVGREQIRDWALGLEMEGLDGWQYPYEQVLIDDKAGQVLGLWRQVADATREDGSHYEIAGLGGSWFRYAGNYEWSWQRDWFDFGNAAALFIEMMTDGVLSEGMTMRMERSAKGQPGHFKLNEAPVGLWEVPNE
jgi:hypothetical protein